MGQYPSLEDLDMSQAIGGQPDENPNYYFQANRIDKIDPATLAAFKSMAMDYYTRTGEPLKATDTFRTNQEQTDVFRRKPNLAAPPGKSRHETGHAIDIDQSQVPQLEKLGLIDKYGFTRPALASKGETWHIELPREQQAMNVMGQRLQELQGQRQPQQMTQAQPGQDFYNQGMQFFTSKGYSPAQAAGIVGNLMHESGGQPDILHDKGAGYGLAGWNGDRRQALYQFAGTDRPDINQQLAFVDYELKNSEPQAYQALQQAKSPEQAAQIFSNLYERPGKPMMNERIKHSRNAMNAYSMGQAGSMAAGPATPSGMPDISQLDMGQAIKAPDVSQLDMEQAVQGPEEKSLGQQIASTVAPVTKYVLPGAGMIGGGILGMGGGPAGEIAGLTGGAMLGNVAQKNLLNYAGLEPTPENNMQGTIDALKTFAQSGFEGVTGFLGNKFIAEPVMKYIGNKIAPRLYDGVLKMTTTLDPALREKLANWGLEKTFFPSKGGYAKLQEAKKVLQSTIDDMVAQETKAGSKISTDEIVARLDSTIEKFKNAPEASEAISLIQEYKNKFLNEWGPEMTPDVVHAMKKTIYKMLPSNAYSKGQFQLAQSMRKDMARGLKETLEELIPGLGELNANQATNIEFQKVLKAAVNRLDNRNVFSLADLFLGGSGYMHGGTWEGLGLLAASKILRDPGLNSFVAMGLKRMPMLNYQGLLGQATTGPAITEAVGNRIPKPNWGELWPEPSFQP